MNPSIPWSKDFLKNFNLIRWEKSSMYQWSGFHLDTSFLVKLVQLLLPALNWSRLTSQAQLGLPSHIVLLFLTQAFDRDQKWGRVLIENFSFLWSSCASKSQGGFVWKNENRIVWAQGQYLTDGGWKCPHEPCPQHLCNSGLRWKHSDAEVWMSNIFLCFLSISNTGQEGS